MAGHRHPDAGQVGGKVLPGRTAHPPQVDIGDNTGRDGPDSAAKIQRQAQRPHETAGRAQRQHPQRDIPVGQVTGRSRHDQQIGLQRKRPRQDLGQPRRLGHRQLGEQPHPSPRSNPGTVKRAATARRAGR